LPDVFRKLGAFDFFSQGVDIMASVSHHAIESHISEILQVADTILNRNADRDLIDKVTVLKGYWELSQMIPDRDYSSILSRALAELTPAVHYYLTHDLEQGTTVFELSP
jgi:hypothetical protein